MAPQDSQVVGDDARKWPKLKINNQTYTVGRNVPKSTTLIDYLRTYAHLPGTKVLCREGGCGVCTVVATVPDHENPGSDKTFSAQACQLLVYACDGWSIETIEHLGNRHGDYHSLQKALSGFYGTQCGYCSPGMIMTAYGQLKSSGSLTVEQVEKALDGNICRCTGYRPILDAFKSLATDAPQHLKDKLVDIEEAYKAKCPKTGQSCKGTCSRSEDVAGCRGKQEPREDMALTDGAVKWFRPVSMANLVKSMKTLEDGEKYRIVVGNTGQGVYKHDGPYTTYISTGAIQELHRVTMGSPLTLGANVTLARAIEAFQQAADAYPGYEYLKEVAKHWQYVANVSVRNAGCWAGNLMLKHQHRDFPSDIFLTLLAASGQLAVLDVDTSATSHLTLEQFLEADMSRSVIVSVSLPPFKPNEQLRTFKITPRAVNAHAYVNACIKMALDASDGFRVVQTPTILFGGINPDFIHAKQTESFLTSKRVVDVATVVKAAGVLASELVPDNRPQDATPQYRKSLAQALLYKAVVSMVGDSAGSEVRSGGGVIERPLSSGSQQFDMNEDLWPVGQGIPKLESATQISGEAVYLDDAPPLPGELHGAFVQSRYAKAKVKSVNPAQALGVAGVRGFISVGDIPGRNSFVATAGAFPDPVFAGETVKHAGQAIGLVVASDRKTAEEAAKLVEVEYDEIAKPVLTIEEALTAGETETAVNFLTGEKESYKFGDVEEAFKTPKNELIGELHQGTQFHLTMEAIAARVIPTEDGYDVFSTSQWPTETQAVVADVLDEPAHCINVTVRRLGGGYGGKISRQHVVCAAAAVAAKKLQAPVRVTLDLNTHMTIVGWREPFLSKYQVSFDDTGKIEGLKIDMVSDGGHVPNETSVGFLGGPVQNCYHIPNLEFRPIVARTNTAANTWCRTPGTVEALATVENVLERIAHHLRKDPLEVRVVNMAPARVPRLLHEGFERNVVLEDILPLMKEKAAYLQRQQEVEAFNKANRWRKRGLSIVPLWYGYNYPSMFRYGVQVVVYEHDGTVAISHGGIEMGQGINTKVAQVAAHTLGIPVEKVVVKASDTVVGANSMVTGGSFGTDICAHGAKVACESLHRRMEEVREKMRQRSEEEPTWLQVVKKCLAEDVDLSQRYWTAGKEHPQGYDIWAACCLEVEIDALTGQYLLRRADIIEDCGRSMNPYVDVGQVEGAFVMGLGMYTSEMVKFHPDTGAKLSNGTWEYKPPTALDIPVDMRVTLLPNASNPYGVLGSKATGEPALCFSYVVVTALRHAITAFREQMGNTDWFDMDTPVTVEKVQGLCGVRPDQFIVSAADDPPRDTEPDQSNVPGRDIDTEDFDIVEKPIETENTSCFMN